MKRSIMIIITIMLMFGCASTSPRLKAVLAPAENIGSSVYCTAGCKDEWERAQFWIAKHSKWKIQTSTDILIETYRPIRQEVSYGFSVMKEPAGGGNYSITMNLVCGNGLGCSPKPIDVMNAFLYYVKTGNDLLVGQGYLGSIR